VHIQSVVSLNCWCK